MYAVKGATYPGAEAAVCLGPGSALGLTFYEVRTASSAISAQERAALFPADSAGGRTLPWDRATRDAERKATFDGPTVRARGQWRAGPLC